MLFGSTVLEVAIGLVFVYLLLSLLCSAITEYIEAKANNRAKYLKQGIGLLLNDTDGSGADLAAQLYAHGLVRPLYRSATKLPSYIPSRTFALALWNIASSVADSKEDGSSGLSMDVAQIRAAIAGHLPNKELKTALLTMIDEANGDIERARRNIEEWYDAMMDRVSGWYKRYTTVVLLLLGIAVASFINADTVSLTRALAQNSALRQSIVATAQTHLDAQSSAQAGADSNTPEERDKAATAQLKKAYDDVSALGLPLGWVAWSADTRDLRRAPDTFGGWLLKIVGLLLTGFAISQGSPFWFDLLNKFMVIRSTVKPSEKSREQPSKDRPASQTASTGTDDGEERGGGKLP